MTSRNEKDPAESVARVPYLDSAPPAYEQHEYDEVYTTNDYADDRLSLQPTSSQSGTSSSATTTAAPFSLTMDDSLIYPTTPPSTALYHIPRPLFFNGDRVYLQRSVPREPFPSGKPRRGLNEDLYEIRRIPYTDDRELALIARSPACYGTSLGKSPSCTRIRRVRGLLGSTWEVVVDDVVVMKGLKDKWKYASGPIAAREKTLEFPLRCHDREKQRISGVLEIQTGVEQQVQDLVVAAWCGKIWLLASDSGFNGAIVPVSKKWDKQQKALTDEMYKAAKMHSSDSKRRKSFR